MRTSKGPGEADEEKEGEGEGCSMPAALLVM